MHAQGVGENPEEYRIKKKDHMQTKGRDKIYSRERETKCSAVRDKIKNIKLT